MASQQVCTHIFFMILLIAIANSPFSSCVLVLPSSAPLAPQYHKGPLLVGDEPIKLHVTFYGDFTSLEKETMKAFLHSLSAASPSHIAQFSSSHNNAPHNSRRLSPQSELMMGASLLEEGPASGSSPTVLQWWSLTQAYTDLRGNAVSQSVLLAHEASDNYSLGKLLSRSALASLAHRSAHRAAARGISHAHNLSIHLIFTAADVAVEGFCRHSCGGHAHTLSDGKLGSVVYAWVGNAKEQCPGYCSWPFVRTEFGPPLEPLKAPNGPSADGMIINLAKVLVEAATNPFGDGYYVGGGADGAGVSSVCTGAYGEGAYPGYPGRTWLDLGTGASYNVKGVKQFKFLVPYIWNRVTLSCAVQS